MRESKKLEAASTFLKVRLAAGPIQTIELSELARSAGINPATLEEAKKRTCRSFQKNRAWFVELAPQQEQISLFDDVSIPDWLTPDETLRWARNHPTVRDNPAVQAVADVAEGFRSSAVQDHVETLDEVEREIADILESHTKGTAKQFAAALTAAISAIRAAGPPSLRTE